ncbi:transcription termination factor Rho [Candidatus Dojkabacteria bacterium]|nr:transcription termination factor Rho [Candidatus Dojkabacteria bacterium]
MNVSELSSKTATQLKSLAKKLEIDLGKSNEKTALIKSILKATSEKEGFKYITGILEVMNDRTHGVLRAEALKPSDTDTYISGSQIKKFRLKTGDVVTGPARPPKENEKYFSLLRVDFVWDQEPIEIMKRLDFRKATPIFPDKQIKLETTGDVLSTRMIDLLCPIGYGQRGMIVSPPKAGKTYLLLDIANGISQNHKDIDLMVVLVGERPEEVTHIDRSVDGEVYASNFDEKPEDNCKVAEIALEKAMRMVELGRDVVVLMDSITRLARAYNITMPTSGRTLSGGFDPVALFPPKRFFGAARNIENGGSLTIIATALIDTGSRMDDLIYEEFKGTGNMELHLDRNLAEKRVYPSIDIVRSGTRHEELLLSKEVLNDSWRVRRMLEAVSQEENSTSVLLERLKKTKNNKEFLATLHESVN